MSWKQMEHDDRSQLLKYASRRGLSEADLTSTDDLVVGKEGVILDDQDRGRKPKHLKPRTFEELLSVVGPTAEARKKASTPEARMQRDQLRRMSQEIRGRRVRSRKDEHKSLLRVAAFANLATKAMVGGALGAKEFEAYGVLRDFPNLLMQISIALWFWPNITVQAGSTLSISGPDVHTIVANKLTVEPGARIVVNNNATVTFDCVHLDVQ